jgi:hypothetical protein
LKTKIKNKHSKEPRNLTKQHIQQRKKTKNHTTTSKHENKHTRSPKKQILQQEANTQPLPTSPATSEGKEEPPKNQSNITPDPPSTPHSL